MDREPEQQDVARRKRRLIIAVMIIMAALIAVPAYPLMLIVDSLDRETGSRSDGALQISGTLYLAEPGSSTQVGGQVSELFYPGVSRPLDLVVTNNEDMPIKLTSLTITIDPVTSNAGCDGVKNLEVKKQLASEAMVPANSSGSLTNLGVDESALPVLTMLDLPVSQDACQGVTIPLHFAVESIPARDMSDARGTVGRRLPVTGLLPAIPFLFAIGTGSGLLVAWRRHNKSTATSAQ